MKTNLVFPFIFMWGIPAFMVIREFLKMSEEDKKSALNDFMSLRFIFTLGLMIAGTFFVHAGTLINSSMVKGIGIIFLVVGGFFSALDSWRRSRFRSILLVAILVLIVLVWAV
ncbi:hypothetical protein [Bacillus sp. AK031]